MPNDFDQLIRNAKPEIPAGARARTLESVEPEGAVGSTPAFVRVLPRVAALVLLAVCSGVAAAMLSAPKQQAAVPVDVAAEIAQARTRLDTLEQESPAARIERLKAEVANLEASRKANAENFKQAIASAVATHKTDQMNEWRERHLQHVREHQAREREATIQGLRDRLKLTPDQEKEVRALLESTDKQAEAVIGDFYTRRHGHPDPRMREKFKTLAEEADRKLNALLDAQQRDKIEGPTGIVSSKPEDWGPSMDFHDGTDVDVYSNWITVTRD
jgi:hypothetical protein